jgi:hypothetical protein
MGSKFIVPLELPNYNATPTNTADPSFGLVYLKDDWLKRALNLGIEQDLVLEHPLDNFSVLGTGNTGAITSADTVEEAFDKLQQSLYINLVGDVTGTAAYNAGNLEIVTTVVGGGSSVPLTATKFNTNHNTALGNPYLIDDIVYYSGHIYKALANNDAITPAIGGNAYWSDLGAGFPYRQNVVDWNATSGDYQILNKPTSLSSFTNDPGYLTVESDPVFTASDAYGITATDISNWNAAYAAIDTAHILSATVYATEDIPRGHVVNVITGHTVNPSLGLPGVANADKATESLSNNVLGIVPFTINNNDTGEVIMKGPVYGLDTHGASLGDFAWVGASGDLVYTRPSAPEHAVYVGVVTVVDASNGSIFVDVQNGFELSELHDVLISGTPNDKDVLYYDAPSGTWKNDSISAIGGGSTGGVAHATVSGTDTYTATITGVASYADGDAYLIRFTNGNTTSATLNINSLGAIALYRNNDGPLIGGDIVDGAEMLCVYNSTTNAFQCIGTAPNTLLAYVTNAESTTITKGQPVYVYGGTGDRITVKLAYNTSDATSAQTIGIVQSASIAANQKGLIVVQGQLDNLSLFPTSTWADGDFIYLGATPGSVTNVKPYAPSHLVYLGYVTTASNGSAGRMHVKVQNGYELDELHNVQATSPSNNDVLAYETGTPGQWKTKSISTVLGYTPVPDTRNITINGETHNLTADATFTVSAGNTVGINLANYYNFF